MAASNKKFKERNSEWGISPHHRLKGLGRVLDGPDQHFEHAPSRPPHDLLRVRPEHQTGVDWLEKVRAREESLLYALLHPGQARVVRLGSGPQQPREAPGVLAGGLQQPLGDLLKHARDFAVGPEVLALENVRHAAEPLIAVGGQEGVRVAAPEREELRFIRTLLDGGLEGAGGRRGLLQGGGRKEEK